VLAFTVGGRLLVRTVRVGDHVEAGQLIARLDGRGYEHGAQAARATAQHAQAQLALSERDQARLSQLGDVRAVSRDQLDRIDTAVDAARANREAASVQLQEALREKRETELRAPFAGTVASIHLEPGELAAAGAPVVVLAGAGGLEVELDVPARIATRLDEGAAVSLHFPLDAEQDAQGQITQVGATTAGPGRLFPIIVALAEPPANVRAGSAVDAIFEVPLSEALTVPARAIVAPAGTDPAVFRVRSGKAERVAVELGELLGTRVGVSGPLAPGDHVVVAGYTGLVAGERVEEIAP
jgi:multidrug efflux system membrane fusion protein